MANPDMSLRYYGWATKTTKRSPCTERVEGNAKFRRNLQPKTSLLSDSLLRDTRPSYPTKNEFVSAGRVGFEISIEIFVEDLQNRVSHQFDLQGTASCITLHATKDVEVQNFLCQD